MARSVSPGAKPAGAQRSRKLPQRKTPSRVQSSSELSELDSTSGDSLVFAPAPEEPAPPEIEKILKRTTARAGQEPKYICQKKGSKKPITLTETDLKHVPDMLASFKRRRKIDTIADSDDFPSSAPNEVSRDSLELSEKSDSSDSMALRSKRGRKLGRKVDSEKQKQTRKSTRGTRSQKTFDFTVHEEDEEKSLDGSEIDVPPKRKGRTRRTAVVESSYQGSSDEELLEKSPPPKSSKRQSRNVTNAQDSTHSSDRTRDEHQPTCSRCSEAFEPDLVKIWTRADRNRGRKVRQGSLLDRFRTLDDVYKQGCCLECTICTNSYHFGCLPFEMKKDISTQHKKERLELMRKRDMDPSLDQESITIPPEKRENQPELKLTFKCPGCIKSHLCVVCARPAPLSKGLEEGISTSSITESQSKNLDVHEKPPGANDRSSRDSVAASEFAKESLIFRCTSCKRASHYSCLPAYGKSHPTKLDEIAEYWHSDWTCADCNELSDIPVEIILAWRKPVPKALETTKNLQTGPRELVGELRDKPKDASNGTEVSYKLPSHKDPFEQAEYLCKYENFSFTDCSWVTHSYLCAKHPVLLRNFLTKGPTLDLKQYSGEDLADSGDSDSDTDSSQGGRSPFTLEPDEDAQSKIPPAWLTPEKILSIEFEDEILIEDAKESNIPDTPEEMYEQMERAFIKWEEQSYADATWSDKTPKDSPYFPAFMSALRKYMKFRKFVVPTVKTSSEIAKLDAPRSEKSFVALEKQPDSIPHQLMGFQLEGLNFCYYNWHRQHPTILADEMGLGKTVQMCSLVSVLKNKEKRMPFLIVVPNSTLGNWARECAKWIPELKCVPLPGDSESCEIVQTWELFKNSKKSKRQLAACVVLATYQSAEKHASLLREVQRWEVLIVDEGQRLKSGTKSGLFRALTSLTVGHKILMSGTPLNNNLRELFNLLSFLNPKEYPSDVIDELESRYSALTPELIDELRAKIRPYMLRRTKETVLDLPRLTEIIVPITMRPLQKQVYRGLLSRNANLITSIYSKGGQKKKTTRAGFQNLLMQLRKTCGHPYLYDSEIEPGNVSSVQAHDNLVEASAKLVFLQKFIPKLLARGHRMLVFSQFTMFLDVMERFLDGEKLQYLRLDGSTSQLDRQTRIDHFNRKESNYNIFLLSTKAGGAGINLATADVVIVLDPDWNPHNDLQAISRAHRFGQKKPVSVFKLMMKGSAEEKIVQTGKKKLVLDHLVIQKVSEEEIEAHDVANILQYGAQELLTASDEALQKDVRYTDAELDDLIQRTAGEAISKESADGNLNKPDKSFAFARVWEGRGKELAELDTAQDGDDTINAQNQRSFWDSILQANETERAKALQEEAGTGRGHRKRKDVDYQMTLQSRFDLPNKKSRIESDLSDVGDDSYEPKAANEVSSPSEAELETFVDLKELLPPPTELELQKNREAEQAMKAARRKLNLQKKYDSQQPHSVNPAGAPIPPPNQTEGTSESRTHTSHSNPVNSSNAPPKGKKASRISIIEVPDLKGLPNDQRRRAMDKVLRDLSTKAKGLQSPRLDSLVSSIRSKGQADQGRIMSEAIRVVQELAIQYHGGAPSQHPSNPHQSSSTQLSHQPMSQHRPMQPKLKPMSQHRLMTQRQSMSQQVIPPHPPVPQQQAQHQLNVPRGYYMTQHLVPPQIPHHQAPPGQHMIPPQGTTHHHQVPTYDLTGQHPHGFHQHGFHQHQGVQVQQQHQHHQHQHQQHRQQQQQHPTAGPPGHSFAVLNHVTGTTTAAMGRIQAPAQHSASSSNDFSDIIPLSHLPPPRFSNTNPKAPLRTILKDLNPSHSSGGR